MLRIPLCILLVLSFIMTACSPPEPPDHIGAERQSEAIHEKTRDGGTSENAMPESSNESTPEATPESHQETPPTPPDSTGERQIEMRGITFSCPRAGAIWGTPGMEKSAREVQQLGSNWFTYHPYGWIQNDGTVVSGRISREILLNPLRVAKKLGMKAMLKPHLGYWGSQFSWRGVIGFTNEQEWKRFFSTYTTWIVDQATIAQEGGADLFSIGLEYKLTESREADWRKVIVAVRKVYKGRITYAANWDSYRTIKFWDALDVIGIQAYFPLSSKDNPSEAEISAGWDRVLKSLHEFSKTNGNKRIIFTELGYNRSSKAAKEPWSYDEGGPNADKLKLRCMRVALRRLAQAPHIEGVFLWKWFPDERNSSRDFILQYPAMKKEIGNAWK